jgi:hypothetical protein
MTKVSKQRQAFLKFRISNHRLQIETGCYIKPKIVPEDRICEKCYSSEVVDASYQVSVHLAEGFQRRRLKCEKLTDDK